ncbi:GntR family transcriptional regulator [Marimonas arenosa]|uniref:GntR family transcriptional regulator n=1 Tax=Marimonas arenosa TaxID=1795305 RepID=A0AAE3WA44_9RHOB|nr:GntR family transcriptional regulator [Marimonas arenosa]MDQ2088874.1 GntR family transcriptional regulator [Marimonas arenosa]
MAEPILAEQIAKQLRRDILRGRLAPGASIKERDNAAELGVSRTPMREAIRSLAKEGLVILRPSRSPIVARPSFKQVSDQAEVLIALEKLSAELACKHATEKDVAKIEGIVDHMAAHFDTTDPLDMFEIDMSFHTAIAAASHNKALAETHCSYLQRLWRARYLAASQRRNRERVVNEHMRIVEALKARDISASRAAIDNHLWHLAEDIRGVIEAEAEAGDADPVEAKTGDTT